MNFRIGIVVFAMGLPGGVLAQEIHTSYEFFGFSDDLKYCAFEVYDYAQLEEPAFSRIYFIDVEKNDYSTRPVIAQDPEEGEAAVARVRAANKKKADPYFKNYRIDGKKLGTPIPFRYEETQIGAAFFDTQEFEIEGQHYRLRLSTVPTGVVSDFDARPEVMVVVDLEHDGKTKRLQQATKAPKSWGFIIGYQFLSAYYLQNKIAVFVEYQGPGFEGYPDRQQMIVTGVLD